VADLYWLRTTNIKGAGKSGKITESCLRLIRKNYAENKENENLIFMYGQFLPVSDGRRLGKAFEKRYN
jgi:uncharacterized protein (UPF0335 family)